ncbi:SRPBCC family protein [Krasilnikovia sp. MM14-A1259]|uniref:SRPBCC family protein n=1 Tax=Krasilnikovia sp. MM14-A1259 TaxID=3373539 RepID=UPI00382F888C
MSGRVSKRRRRVAAWTLLGAAAVAVVAAYRPAARRRYLTWGATAVEAAEPMPGDDLVADPDLVSTRAVTIAAPRGAVWPWLVQMGSGRGGAYTYDWIENVFGLDMHSTSRILPQYQNLAAGDELPLGPDGPAMRVERCEPDRLLAFRSPDHRWAWIFQLGDDAEGTRLVSRNRIALPHATRAQRLTYRFVMEPGSLIMERKMLRGIRDRAQAYARRREPVAAGSA